MARNRRREGCCSVYLLRTVLYILNLIFLFAGLGILAVGVWTVTDKYQYVELLTTVTYPVITYFFVAAGGLLLFITILGCCAIWWNNRLCLVFYIFLMLLIFLIQVMVGILAYIYEEQVQHQFELNLNATFLSSYKIETDKTEAIDSLQEKFHCCGALSFEDWEYSTWRKENISGNNLVPDSCCKTITFGCGNIIRPSNINYNSCLNRMSNHMRHHLFILSVVASGISILEVLGIILACQLYFKLRDYIDDL